MHRRRFLSCTAAAGFIPRTATAAPPASFHAADGAVRFAVGGAPVVAYQASPLPLPDGIDPAYARSGYLTDLRTPAGRLVSDDYPPLHRHHHGIWTAWTRCRWQGRDTDFWNMGQKKGRVEAIGHDAPWQRDDAAGLTARHRYIDLTGGSERPVLDEQWGIEVRRIAGHPAIVLAITQRLAGDEPLHLPRYHYGGLGFRGPRSWDGKDGCRFLTSEGVTDRVKGNETRGRWCWIGGDVDGSPCGVLIASHPRNPVHPEPMRLHPTEPFFCFAPPQAGDRTLEAAHTWVSRYLVIPLDGPADAARCRTLAEAFAA